MKKLLVFTLAVTIFSCNNQANKKTTEEVKNETLTETTDSKFGRKNFAVVWKWKTSDKELFEKNMLTISKEMEGLWKDDVIVDSYFNSDAKVSEMDIFPNISCFVKAKSTQDAEKILNQLTLVKLGLATYTIYPVGTKWLGRNTEKIIEREVTKSYVAVWNTVNKNDSATAELIKENAKQQSDAILKLWNDGTIENVYFDIEGTVKNNEKTDFVFFINVNTEAEAKEICDKLPFVKKQMASYKLLPVGLFWLGEYKK